MATECGGGGCGGCGGCSAVRLTTMSLSISSQGKPQTTVGHRGLKKVAARRILDVQLDGVRKMLQFTAKTHPHRHNRQKRKSSTETVRTLTMNCKCGTSAVFCTVTTNTCRCTPTGVSTTLSKNWTNHVDDLHNRDVDHLVSILQLRAPVVAQQRACQQPPRTALGAWERHCG